MHLILSKKKFMSKLCTKIFVLGTGCFRESLIYILKTLVYETANFPANVI